MILFDHQHMVQQSTNVKKTPAELVTRSFKRKPLSARVKSETKEILTKAAEVEKTSLSDLAAAILDDYAGWLIQKKKNKKDKRQK